MMRKPFAVLVICMVLSAGCAPVAAPTATPTFTFPTLTAPKTTPTVMPTTTVTSRILTLTVAATIPTLVGTPGYYPDLLISMSVTDPWCNSGNCRTQWDIDGNGHVSYVEKGRMLRIQSTRSATITPPRIEELVATIQQADVFALQDEYPAPGTDPRIIFLSVTLNGRSKSIRYSPTSRECGEYWGPAPLALCELEHKIEIIVNPDQWVIEPTGTP